MEICKLLYNYVCFRAVQAKIASVIKQIEKIWKMSNSLRASLRSCRSISEVEHLVSSSLDIGNHASLS